MRVRRPCAIVLAALAAAVLLSPPARAQAPVPVDSAGLAREVARFIAEELIREFDAVPSVLIGRAETRFDSLVAAEMARHPAFRRPVRDSAAGARISTVGFTEMPGAPDDLRGLPAVVVRASGCSPDEEGGGGTFWVNQTYYVFRRTDAGWEVAGARTLDNAHGRCGPQVRTATSRIDTFTVSMPQLEGRERTVRVYLPPGYDGSDARYPVLYLQDGQNLFSPGAYGDWRIDETLDSLVAARRTPGLIVVGIDHGGAKRWDEYGPWPNSAMARWVDTSWAQPEEGGEGNLYARWLVNRLKPEIDRRYRTRPEAEHTGIGGSSMGGLIALYTGIYRPDVFGRVMAMSPAVWFAEMEGPWLADNQLAAMIKVWDPPVDARFWIDVGTAERSRETDPDVVDDAGERVTYPRAYIEGAQAVVEALHGRGVPARNITYFIEEGAVHHERAWAIRFEEAVLWLFP